MKWPWSKSITDRIQWGYYTLVALMVIATVVIWAIFPRVRIQISLQEATADLVDSVLEMRRNEKNWMLYGESSEFHTNREMTVRVQALLEAYSSKTFATPGTAKYIEDFRGKLRSYQDLMATEFNSGEARQEARLSDEIRRVGREIVGIAETLKWKEHQTLSRTVDFLTVCGMIFGMSMTFLALILGERLAKSAVAPLEQIVTWTRKISRGEFRPCDNISDTKEMLSVVEAFNTMMEELKSREARIVESEKLAALGTLLAGVAHGLNNPLSNIGTSAQILLGELEDPENPQGEPDRAFAVEMLQQVVDETDRARRMVRSLLEFSRHRVVEREQLTMGPFLEEILTLVQGKVPTHVDLVLEVGQDGIFSADKQRLQQVLLNLLINALHAVGERGRIVLRGGVDPRAKEVAMEVEDDGPGIPPDIREKIFDPFFTTKDVGEGSGLGLAIAREIVRKHQGVLTVESRPDEGTKFLISLPMNVSEEAESLYGARKDSVGG